MRERPLSPHLSVVRFRYTLTSSISNRLTGIVASAGFLLFVYWLVAAASGEPAYADLRGALASLPGRVVLALLLVALVYHTLAGLRHLVWDMGYGLEKAQSQRSAWWLAGTTVVVSALLVWLAFFRAAGAS